MIKVSKSFFITKDMVQGQIFPKKLLALVALITSYVWNNHLEHVSDPIFHNNLVNNGINVIKSPSKLRCEACKLAKSHKQPFSSSRHIVFSSLFHLLYIDIWGPFPFF